MAGKINRQVKSGKPVLINGLWKHPLFDDRAPPPKLMAHLSETAKRLGLKSL